MPQEESLKIKYAQYTDEEILNILCNPSQYTEVALSVAQLEAKKRELPESIIENFEKKQEEELKTTIELALVELTFSEKALAYFLWMFKFLFAILMRDAYNEGHELKVNQLSYYFFGGIIFTFISGFVSMVSDSFIMFFISFICGFWVLLSFDKNRQKILEKYSIDE